MRRVLVITPCAPDVVPTPGELIARRIGEWGVRTSLLSAARTGTRRGLDIAVRGLWRTLRSDVVFVNVYGRRAFAYESLAILYGRLWGKRVVAMVHGGNVPDTVEGHGRWGRWVLSKAHRVLTPNEYLRDRLTALGVRIDGMIPNFIELEKYSYRPRSHLSPRLLYLRGLHPNYNPQMTLRAFAAIQQQRPDAELTVAGRELAYADECRALAESLNLRNVRFVGLVPRAELRRLADHHDLYVQSNRVENMPVTVIEMWASGLPVVSTNVGGIAYLVRDRQDGLLVPPEDHQAMARACLELLSDAALAGRLSANGRQRASELTWEHVAGAWREALGLDVAPAEPCG